MKVVFTIIGVILVLLMFGTMLGGINDAKTDLRTDSYGTPGTDTGGGDFDTDVVLVADLFENSILNVPTIASTNADDVPIVDSYVSATNTLTVKGLEASGTRTLAVTYMIDALTNSPGVGTFFDFLPLLIGIAIVVIVIAAMVMAFKNR